MKKLIAKWFKIKICPNCASLNISRGYYSRGWNNWCNQAYGDDGIYCNNCCKVTFNKTLEDHKKTLPNWCTPTR